jgi:hypothetical protein
VLIFEGDGVNAVTMSPLTETGVKRRRGVIVVTIGEGGQRPRGWPLTHSIQANDIAKRIPLLKTAKSSPLPA